MGKFLHISYIWLKFLFVCVAVVVIAWFVVWLVARLATFSKADKDVEPGYCGGEEKCEPINLTLVQTNEVVSLPTHCLNILNKDASRCAWFWPEGADELFNIDKYIDPKETTKNLRDWAKNRQDDFFPHIDLNKFPQHHQTIEIVTEGHCPTPFMNFIVLGETNTNEKFGICAVLPKDMVNVFNHLGVSVALA